MPHSEELTGLLTLAWENCRKDILAVLDMILGGLLFAIFYMAFVFVNVLNAESHLVVTEQYLAISGMFHDIFMGTLFGVLELLLWLAVVTILFEYALSFTTVCYYYDGKSWVIPKLLHGVNDSINNHFKSQRDENASADRKHRIYLENEILKIRTRKSTAKADDKD